MLLLRLSFRRRLRLRRILSLWRRWLVALLRRRSERQTLTLLGRRGRFHLELFRHFHVRALDDLIEHFFALVLLDCAPRLVTTGTATFTGGDQDVARMHLFFGLSVLGFSAPTFKLDDVIAELGLDDVADLARLQREGSLFKLRRHHAVAEPFQLAAAALAAGIGRVFLGQLREILAGARPLQ